MWTHVPRDLIWSDVLKNHYRRWVEALSRTRNSNKAPVVVDPRPRRIFVGQRPPQGETYVGYDVLEQVWVLWNTFLVQRVGVYPRQGRPIAMVRSQPPIIVLDSPHLARWPTQYTSAIRQAHRWIQCLSSFLLCGMYSAVSHGKISSRYHRI